MPVSPQSSFSSLYFFFCDGFVYLQNPPNVPVLDSSILLLYFLPLYRFSFFFSSRSMLVHLVSLPPHLGADYRPLCTPCVPSSFCWSGFISTVTTFLKTPFYPKVLLPSCSDFHILLFLFVRLRANIATSHVPLSPPPSPYNSVRCNRERQCSLVMALMSSSLNSRPMQSPASSWSFPPKLLLWYFRLEV